MGQIVLLFAGLAVFCYVAMAAGLTSLAAVCASGHKLRKWAHQIDPDLYAWGALCLFVCLLKVTHGLFGGGAVLLLIFGPLVGLSVWVWITAAVSMVRK